MHTVDVSVIIPNYNYARFLPECLASVFGSDMESHRFEVLLVDDASTDLSVPIARDQAFHQGRDLRIIRHDVNLGLPKSRNTGIRLARGEFLFFLDSDNRIAADCLRMHWETLSSDPGMDACYGPIQDFIAGEEGDGIHSVRSDSLFDYQRLLTGNYIDGMAMFRAEVFNRLGGYDEVMPNCGWEDYEYWLRLGMNGCRVEFIPGPPLSHYRLHSSSMTEKVTKRHLHNLWKYLDGIYDLKFRIDSDG